MLNSRLSEEIIIIIIITTGEPRETAFLFSAFVYRCSKV